MGGLGSGDWYRFDKKPTVEGCRVLDINRLARDGMLRPGWCGSIVWTDQRTGEQTSSAGYRVRPDSDGGLTITLEYRFGTGDEITLPIRLQTTQPNFGGLRWWLTCPLVVRGVACRRRVAKLYLRGRYYGCRRCHDLTYESCQEAHRFDRALGELGADFGLTAGEVARLLRGRS